jgi:3-methyladenine DNA glycosylase AlkC
MSEASHPAVRYAAPSAILAGKPLKYLLGTELVTLIGESLAHVPGFDLRRFKTRAVKGLERLELKQRADHIARAMAEQLPDDFDESAPLVIRSLGPPLANTEGNGLAVFFYFPHSHLIAERGVDRFESGMRANYELTKRFTAEFSIRPLLVEHRTKALKLLARWTRDPDPHVRRLVSEGTRPRLPWAMRLPEFLADPNLALPLLEKLKDDPVLYVRRSVANHLGDIAKDHPEVAFDVCETWLDEVAGSQDADAENRRWMIRHAVRLPAKKGVRRALRIRKSAAGRASKRN